MNSAVEHEEVSGRAAADNRLNVPLLIYARCSIEGRDGCTVLSTVANGASMEVCSE